ncbi:MAG: DUF4388 domain-containing protein [Planctomycetota bacterium]
MAKPTSAQSVDAQIHAFAEIGKLERRVTEMEDLVAVVKRRCLDGSVEALPELVTATSELRWHLRQVATHLFYAEHHLGITGRGMPEVRSEPTASVTKAPTSGLRGTTDTLGLTDLLNLLSTLHKTGTLTLQANETIYVLEFLRGAIVHAVTNHRSPEWRLGTILEAQSKLTPEQLQSNLEAVDRTKELLGDRLVRTECVTEGDLRAALEMQVRNLFENLFAIRFARFTFLEGGISNTGQRVCLNTTQLLLETARRQDEGKALPPMLQAQIDELRVGPIGVPPTGTPGGAGVH